MSKQKRASGEGADSQGPQQFVETDGAETADAQPETVSAQPERREPQSAAPAQPAARSGSRASGWLALIMALMALGLSAWLLFERHGEDEVEPLALADAGDVAALESRLEALAEQLATQSDRYGRLLESQAEIAAQVDGLTEQLNSGLAALERRSSELTGENTTRLDGISTTLDELAARLQQSVDDWAERGDLERQAERDLQRQVAMLEAAALLGLAQHRVELVGDLDGARAAYRRAASQLATINDARLDRTRQALARELEALESARAPDLNRALARLERLAAESRSWPSQLGDELGVQPMPAVDPGAEEQHWRERIAGAARGLVRVQARDELGRTTEQFDAARELVQLRLVAAQLALVRHDESGLRLQLEAAVALVDEWFDGASAEVSQARADLTTLADINLAPVMPEIGEALSLLRRRLGES